MPSEDMQQYMSVFLDEATEHIEKLEQSILSLEHSCTSDLLQEIFRSAHTLKGSSRAMGFGSMGELTHAMEDIFDRLRRDELVVTHDIVDALFKAIDILKSLKEEIANGGVDQTDTTEIVKLLRGLIDPSASPTRIADSSTVCTEKPISLTQTEQIAISDAISTGAMIYDIKVELDKDCVMKSVRALMTLQRLETIGILIHISPSEQALEDEDFEFSFELLLATDKSIEDINAEITGISEISIVVVTPYRAMIGMPASVQTANVGTICEADSVPSPDIEHSPIREKPQKMEDEESSKEEKKMTHHVAQTVRVDVGRLDNLLNLVGELVIDQTRINQLVSQLHSPLDEEIKELLQEAAAHFGRITGDMQEQIMKARMLPIDNVFNRFPRMMRDLSQKLNKEIDFVIWGRETELDRSVIEVIGDPLIHILRNSVDHGIESMEQREAAGKPRCGTVRLGARHEENYIVIEIEDDGAGIDIAKVKSSAVRKGLITAEIAERMSDKDATNLIFHSGLSTAEQVSDISGRGVGMDIVRNNLIRFGAIIDVDSRPGKGTRFTIKLPLTLAIIRGLLVRVVSGVYVIPLASVIETNIIDCGSIHVINGQEVIMQRGMALPLLHLDNLYYSERETSTVRQTSTYIVVVGSADRKVGLVVDSMLGEQEIVIKPLGKYIGDIRGVSGATILGDGRIALIVDVNGLIAIAHEEKVKTYVS